MKSQLFKVTNKGKPPQMFWLSYNFSKAMPNFFLPVEISSKKVRANKVGFSTTRIKLKIVSRKLCIFQLEKLHQKKYVETTWIFLPSKLHRKTYVKTTCIFQPAKLHRKKCVETEWIFRPVKLYRKTFLETTRIFRAPILH